MKNVADICALAPLQQLMLAQSLSGRDVGLLVQQFHCTLGGKLDSALLRQAIEAVIRRHPLLRVCFAWEKLKKPVQVVREHVQVPWAEHDWRDGPPAEVAGRLKVFLADDRRAGFDLTEAPLSRFHLIRTADDAWRFIWTCHHLVLDGWSAAVVIRDILLAYDRIDRRQAIDWEPAGAFADYLRWLVAQDRADADQFWKRQLHDLPAPSQLPGRHTGPDQQPIDAPGHHALTARLDSGATAGLQRLAGHGHVSLGVVIQAAWTVLLGHYLEATDVVFGMAVSGRPPQVARVESLVAPLANNVPRRVAFNWDDRLSELLSRLQQLQSEAQPYEYCPLDQIARAAEVSVERRLFESLIVIENYPLGDTGTGQAGAVAISDFHGSATSNLPLSLVVIPGRELELRLLYDAGRYPADRMKPLLNQLVTLLAGMARTPEARLCELVLATGGDSADSNLRHDEFQVLDRFGRAAPVGLPGAIWSTGPDSRPLGYRGVREADGTLSWLGRTDAALVVDRYGVDPREVTAVLTLHPFVKTAIVVPRANPQGVRQLAAFVVPSADAQTVIESGQHALLLEQLRRFLADRMPEPMVPRIWRALEALPRHQSGDVDLDRLPVAFRPRSAVAPPYLAPRDLPEERLCAIWSELLGVEPVGIEDDFFDLGGHSSMAVALAARIEEVFQRRLPLASVFEQPTVARLAELLRRQPGGFPETPLVPIRADGTHAPLFCVHPAGGTVLCYVELARHLAPEIPVYGLQALGLDGLSAPLDSIPAMAAAYTQAMKSVQPVGPYHLCGWSTGGIIAFEIARQLDAAGDEAALVMLFDSAIPREEEQFDEQDLAMLLGFLFPGDDLANIRQLDRQQQLEAFQRRAERANLLFASESASQVARIYDVFQANMKAVAEYRPAPLHQPIILVRASQQVTPMHADPFLGWQPWAAAGIEVLDVSSAHLAMFQQPGVAEVAKLLNERLAASSLTASPEITAAGAARR